MMITTHFVLIPTVVLSLIQTSSAGCDDYEGWAWMGNSCESITDGECDFVSQFFEFNGIRANEACCKCGGGVVNDICEDEPGWYWGGTPFFTCGNSVNSVNDCQLISNTFGQYNGKTAWEACCVCGGGSHVGPVTPSPTNNPTNSPTTSPTSEPTKSPTDHPSLNPTTSPTIFPSDSPTEKCFDEPGWYWGGNPNHTCELTVSTAFCDTISDLGIFKGKSATHACCVCGGGEHIAAPSDPPSSSPSNIFSSAPSSTPCEHDERWYYMGNTDFTCEVVTPSFCENVNHYPQNGLYASEACCFCGGGIAVTKSPTATPTASPTVKPSVSPTIPEQCEDVPGWVWAGSEPCGVIHPSTCESISKYFTYNGLTANDACCICGGGLTTSTTEPTKAPTANPTIAPTTNPTTSPTGQPTGTPTATSLPSASPTEAPYIRTCKPNQVMGQTIITYTPEVPRVCFKIVLDENGDGAFYGDHRNPSCSKPYDENSFPYNKMTYGLYSGIVGNRIEFSPGQMGYSGLLIFRETNQVVKSRMIVTAWNPELLQFRATVLLPSCQSI